jgi:hypothetical protein
LHVVRSIDENVHRPPPPRKELEDSSRSDVGVHLHHDVVIAVREGVTARAAAEENDAARAESLYDRPRDLLQDILLREHGRSCGLGRER